jgi:hypothetical protein
MKKFLKEFKDHNDKSYWNTLIEMNRGSRAFRETFKEFIEEKECHFSSKVQS